MRTYTYSQARQQLAALLDEAKREGSVAIRRRDGSLFVLKPEGSGRGSGLDVEGVDLGLTRDEIVDLVRAGRERL